MEKATSHGIIENIGVEGTLECKVNICEPTNASKGELFHSRKVLAPICLQNLLSFLHLLTRKTRGKDLLIDYNQSHVYTFDEYLQMLCQKNMDKEVAEVIREQSRNEREEIKKKCAAYSDSAIDKAIQRLLKK